MKTVAEAKLQSQLNTDLYQHGIPGYGRKVPPGYKVPPKHQDEAGALFRSAKQVRENNTGEGREEVKHLGKELKQRCQD